MGTRGVIARATSDGFSGRYHHWDSYPTGLGKTLYNLYNNHFGKDLKAMCEFLIDNHTAGWSTINDRDLTVAPGFGGQGAECYCHGNRHEREWDCNQSNASGSGCEYAYVFDEGLVMRILSSYSDNVKMIGMFGMGDENAEWHEIACVTLDGPEPDWTSIEGNTGSSKG